VTCRQIKNLSVITSSVNGHDEDFPMLKRKQIHSLDDDPSESLQIWWYRVAFFYGTQSMDQQPLSHNINPSL
jgi:hypothetical protein